MTRERMTQSATTSEVYEGERGDCKRDKEVWYGMVVDRTLAIQKKGCGVGGERERDLFFLLLPRKREPQPGRRRAIRLNGERRRARDLPLESHRYSDEKVTLFLVGVVLINTAIMGFIQKRAWAGYNILKQLLDCVFGSRNSWEPMNSSMIVVLPEDPVSVGCSGLFVIRSSPRESTFHDEQ
eukprot:scaffold2219_cov177-Amphora_coffeaeformis.AAC.16